MEKLPGQTVMKTATKNTCPQPVVSCLVGQGSDEFEVRRFIGSSELKFPIRG